MSEVTTDTELASFFVEADGDATTPKKRTMPARPLQLDNPSKSMLTTPNIIVHTLRTITQSSTIRYRFSGKCLHFTPLYIIHKRKVKISTPNPNKRAEFRSVIKYALCRVVSK